MKSHDQIPYYAFDGRSLGFRSLEAATRLVAGGSVKASYGRKKNLRAIWLVKEVGNSVETYARTGTRYSFLQNLDSGRRCWKLRRLVLRDDDGSLVPTRGVFLQVIADCTVA